MSSRKEMCYYGPEDLIKDYEMYGVHRLPIAAKIFKQKYIDLACEIGSDKTPIKRKKELRKSDDFLRLMSIPPAAYYRKMWRKKGGVTYYVATDKLLNASEINLHNKHLEEEEYDSDNENAFYMDVDEHLIEDN